MCISRVSLEYPKVVFKSTDSKEINNFFKLPQVALMLQPCENQEYIYAHLSK